MLTPGTRLGVYEVDALLGAGGMGEVYRAHDRRLGRDVALKVLPAEFSAHPDRLARFAREARVLAALSHPHIAAIYGFEEADGMRAIVLELVEGPTLAERLLEDPIPVREAIGIARQIAEALEAAHEKAIVHRDLKPPNIKVTPDGNVKVLDFGLAKAFEPSAASEPVESQTITTHKTRPGALLGTTAYMSPEQVRGEPVDKRTDIWAFGCVLYEMLTGREAFPGETSSDTIAAVLNQDPDWSALPASTPELVRTVLRRCLEKDRKRRLRDIGDAALELEAAAASTLTTAETTGIRSGVRRRWSWRVAGAVGLMLVLIAVTVALWQSLWRRGPVAAEPVRMTALLPAGVTVTEGPGYASSLALSPDGRILVVAGMSDDGLRLYQRPLDRLQATPLAGTEGGTSPFFSPDGQWIGFFAEGRLRRIPVGGGPAVDIATVPEQHARVSASWGPDDRIVLVWGIGTPLHSVDMRGGSPELVTKHEDGETGHYRPEVLADGRTLLFDDLRWIYALDRVSGRRTRLVQGIAPRYAYKGQLLFCRDTTLLAAPFDPTRLEITGPAVPLVEGVGESAGSDTKHYAISRSGTLAYLPVAATHSLMLLNADGTERVIEEAVWFENPQFSPDGRLLAVATRRRPGETTDIWVHDLERGAASRLTFDGGRAPAWTPDGTAITYSHLGDEQGIYLKSLDGRADAKRLLALDQFHWLVGWTPDGRTLAYGRLELPRGPGTMRSSIGALAEGRSRNIVEPGPVWGGRLSPDGRWLAYYRLESGSFEVYVSRFPEAGTRWLISEGGGRDPSWGTDGSELYYRSGHRLMAARIDTKTGVRVLSRRVVLEPFRPPLYDDYDLHPDGRTLAIVRPAADLAGQVTLVLNWHEELKRLVPPHQK